MYYVINVLEWAIFALSATRAPLERINIKERLENSPKLRKVSCIFFFIFFYINLPTSIHLDFYLMANLQPITWFFSYIYQR